MNSRSSHGRVLIPLIWSTCSTYITISHVRNALSCLHASSAILDCKAEISDVIAAGIDLLSQLPWQPSWRPWRIHGMIPEEPQAQHLFCRCKMPHLQLYLNRLWWAWYQAYQVVLKKIYFTKHINCTRLRVYIYSLCDSRPLFLGKWRLQ